jgi:hypothetical protein
MEDIWNLHGGIVYIGIRKFVYSMPCPEDTRPAITSAIDRFLAGFDITSQAAEIGPELTAGETT